MRQFFLQFVVVILSTFFCFTLSAQDGGTGGNNQKIKLLSAKLDSNNMVLAVRLDAPYKDSVEAILTHSIGWVVEKKKVVLSTGPNNFSFNTAQLAEGTYRLIIRRFEGNWSLTQTIKKD